jgi:hypothetical protein
MIQGIGLHNPDREPLAWVVYEVKWNGMVLDTWKDYKDAFDSADRNPGAKVTAIVFKAPQVYGANRTILSDVPVEAERREVYTS